MHVFIIFFIAAFVSTIETFVPTRRTIPPPPPPQAKVTLWKGIELYYCTHALGRIECTAQIKGDICQVLNGRLKINIPHGVHVNRGDVFILTHTDDDMLRISAGGGQIVEMQMAYHTFAKIRQELVE